MEYVYVGNVLPGEEGECTYCPKCKTLLINRYGFSAEVKNLKENKCGSCGKTLNIII